MEHYPSIRIEGGLLGPDLLDEIRAGDLHGQRAADFVVEPAAIGAAAGAPVGLAPGTADSRRQAARRPSRRRGGADVVREARPVYGERPRPARSLTDQIARAFADARSLWSVFQHRCERIRAGDRLATSITRDAWVVPFLGLLDYDVVYNRRARDLGGLTFAISHRAGDAAEAPPVHIVGVGQELGRAPATGRPRLAPHALLQEYLNRTEALWGVVTNGRTLRLLRDCTYIRRQAYVEFDLPGIIDEQRFEDFDALYRLLHRSRLPGAAGAADDCLLETYYQHGVEQGGRVRDRLRDGVEECIRRLANGFLRHPDNDRLRRRVTAAASAADRIAPPAFYRDLLRLVYRFLFLLVAEDRRLLGADPLYHDHYGVGRLRRWLDRPAIGRDHDDLWQSLCVVWHVMASNQAEQPEEAGGAESPAALLGLPVLNGGLFAPGPFDDATIGNRDLVGAFECLARYEEKPSAPRRRVNYAALDVEELGSVYESLLDFDPVIHAGASGLPEFDLPPGSSRKSTGSYYTPPSLVAKLVESALEPVLAERLKAVAGRSAEAQAQAVLKLRVCDPACGSGHFLLAAARRLGKKVAQLRTGEFEPAPERVREAVREVVAHSIYGVDRNPLAVDLCRVALWIESHEADKPLTFLDHRIKCGDSLVGVFDLKVLGNGIPDEAFKPLKGDDSATARRLKARNRTERRASQASLPYDAGPALAAFAEIGQEIDATRDDSPDYVRQKGILFKRLANSPVLRHQQGACNLWTGAFFQPLRPAAPVITTAILADFLDDRKIDSRVLIEADDLAKRYRFFHWPLEFPEVFTGSGPGFDVVLGNPPWGRIKLYEKKFFEIRSEPEAIPIATAPNAAERKRLIAGLRANHVALHDAFQHALRTSETISSFFRGSGRYPLCGCGDVNIYAVFAEMIRRLINDHGCLGCVLPTGIATDNTTKQFFRDVMEKRSLVSLFDFRNNDIFPDVASPYKFCLFTVGSSLAESDAQFVFFARDVREIEDAGRRFVLSRDDIALLNPDTYTCPIFRSSSDAEITKAVYRRVQASSLKPQASSLKPQASSLKPQASSLKPPHIIASRPEQPAGLPATTVGDSPLRPNPWGIRFQAMFHMSNDSHLFLTRMNLESDGWRPVLATKAVLGRSDSSE